MNSEYTYSSILDDDTTITRRTKGYAKIHKSVEEFISTHEYIANHLTEMLFPIMLAVNVKYSSNVTVVAGSTTVFLPTYRVNIRITPNDDVNTFRQALINAMNDIIEDKYLEDDSFDITLNLRTV